MLFLLFTFPNVSRKRVKESFLKVFNNSSYNIGIALEGHITKYNTIVWKTFDLQDLNISNTRYFG